MISGLLMDWKIKKMILDCSINEIMNWWLIDGWMNFSLIEVLMGKWCNQSWFHYRNDKLIDDEWMIWSKLLFVFWWPSFNLSDNKIVREMFVCVDEVSRVFEDGCYNIWLQLTYVWLKKTISDIQYILHMPFNSWNQKTHNHMGLRNWDWGNFSGRRA